MSAATRYRSRSIYANVRVDLDDIDEDDLVEYLRDNGYVVVPGSTQGGPTDDGMAIDQDDLNRVFTLLLCGQREAAREFVLQLVSDHLGRPL